MDNTSYMLLALLVSGWCVVHSAMICMTVTDYLKERLGAAFRFYRLFYNIVATLTFAWDGYFRVLQVLLLGISVVLFYLGARHYDARQLLGLRQISDGTSHTAISGTGQLESTGVLGITRHPWYLGVLLVIWARPLDVSALIVNGLLTVYLVTGSWLEEQKLIREFGDTYRNYQNRVSMLIPYKWFRKKTGAEQDFF
jgi:protein-S-isoprenylcysteine O-methyltransferase Ste14